MTIMTSARLRSRKRYAESVLSAVDALWGKATDGLEARLGDVEGFDRAHIAAQGPFQGAIVKRALVGLERAEAELVAETGQDAQTRDARDTAHEALWDEVTYTRRSLLLELTAQQMRGLGLASAPPRGHANFEAYTTNAIAQLRAQDLQVTPRRGSAYTTAELAPELEARLKAYADARAAVALDERETQAAREVRDQAVADFEQLVFAAAAILEGLFRQAGMVAIAERIRPSSLRVSGRLEEDPLPDQDEADAPTPPQEA